MPMSCAELLPEISSFISFFEAVARGLIVKDRPLSKKLFRVLALREKLTESTERVKEINPVDFLLRKTVCFYREQRDPTRVVPYDDANFLHFLKSGMAELETKVDDAIYQWEFEKSQRRAYEAKLKATEGAAERLREEAEEEANQRFNKLSQNAKKKAERP